MRLGNEAFYSEGVNKMMKKENGMLTGKQRIFMDKGKLILGASIGFAIGIVIAHLVYIILWSVALITHGEYPQGFYPILMLTTIVSMAVSTYFYVENSSAVTGVRETIVERVDSLGTAYVLHFVGSYRPYLLEFLTDEERNYIRNLRPGDTFKYRAYWRKFRIAEIIQ